MSSLILVVALLAQAHPPALQTKPPSCTVQDAPHSSDDIVAPLQLYSCETETPAVPAFVSKTWFKHHCKATKDGATCDAYAVANQTLDPRQLAGPHKFAPHLKRIGEVAVIVGLGVLLLGTGAIAG